jgi:hypothetical protein
MTPRSYSLRIRRAAERKNTNKTRMAIAGINVIPTPFLKVHRLREVRWLRVHRPDGFWAQGLSRGQPVFRIADS